MANILTVKSSFPIPLRGQRGRKQRNTGFETKLTLPQNPINGLS